MKTLKTRFTELAAIRFPIVQEGMGPFRTSRLAAAVSSAGGLGTVSIPGMTASPAEGARAMRAQIDEVMGLTSETFAVNVPVGVTATGEMMPVSAAYVDAVLAARESDPAIARQLRVLTTSAGFPGVFRERIKESKIIHMHKVGSTRQALKAEAAGVDVVIASGYEMGGHTHASPVHTFVLIPNVTAKVRVPVLLSGGARDGRTLAAALAMGAEGVAMGTRFIATYENEWHPAYRQKIVDAVEGDDTIFPSVYGPGRGLKNHGVELLRALSDRGEMSSDALNEWKDRALIRAQSAGDIEDGLIAAGQVSSAIESIVHVAEFVPRMAEEACEILQALGQRIKG